MERQRDRRRRAGDQAHRVAGPNDRRKTPAVRRWPLLDDRQRGAADRRRFGGRSGPPAGPAAPAASSRRCRGRPGGSPATAGESGSAVTSGVPASACSRSASESGTLPSSGTSSSSASSWPPPSPKIVKRSPSGVVKPDMFSITPRISRSNLVAISAPRWATDWAAGCGVVTIEELGLGQQLGERHRDVAGPRRQVEQQVLELAPGDVLEELLDRLVQHRAAPDDGRVLLDEEADRHHLDAAGRVQRQDLALAVDVGLGVDAEHARDRVAVDVAVEGAGRVAFGGQRRGQVGGHRRLADAALAGGDADHVLDLGQRPCRQLAAAERFLQVAFLLVGEDVEADRDLGHAVELGDLPGRPPVRSGSGSGSRRWSARRRPRPGRSRWTSIERTMPSSTIERRSSGSITARSFSVI